MTSAGIKVADELKATPATHEPQVNQFRKALKFRNAAALYIFGLLFLVFAFWVPDSFLRWDTWRSLLSTQAITCLIAVGLVFPIAAGAIDLAVGAAVGLAAVVVAKLLVGAQVGIVLAVVITLAVGAVVGTVSWLLITRAKIPSFIATLGLSSLLLAGIAWVSDSQQIVNLPAGFSALATGQLFGLTYPFYIMIVVAAVLWYVLERTPLGRRIYATGAGAGGMGGSTEAASLAGVRTSRILLFALVTGGVVSALSGLLVTSQLSAGDPTIGPGYLLPVIAAVFLGSTQFRGGRFNIWGTVVAAYVLATGVKGLQLAGLPIWIPDAFNGAALLIAVGLAAWRRPPIPRREAIRRLLFGHSADARSRRRRQSAELIQRYHASNHVTAADAAAAVPARGYGLSQLRKGFGFRNAAAVYLFVILFVVFALWVPDSFLRWGTWRSLLSNQAITCLIAVGLVFPIAAGALDLAVGAAVGLAAVLVAQLLVGAGVGVVAAVLITLIVGAVVGTVSWLLITKAKIPSFIATLGLSSLLLASISWVSDSQQIVNLPAGFSELATGQLFGLAYPFYIMIVVAAVLWYVLERTPLGRRIYAIGANTEVALLSGVRTSRILLFALITGGVVSALSGLLITSQLSAGDPTIGPGYLLPVIAAVFLGSTQFRGGRPNIWGTVVAAYVLATGVKGLQLAGLPIWIPDAFNGAALLLAVGLAAWQRAPRTKPDLLGSASKPQPSPEPVTPH